MQIFSDTTGRTTNHIRDIKIEDGPVLDAGSNYALSTRLKIDYLRVISYNDEPLKSITASYRRLTGNALPGTVRHERVYHDRGIPRDVPAWLKDLFGSHLRSMEKES
jgi:hypothetical protein